MEVTKQNNKGMAQHEFMINKKIIETIENKNTQSPIPRKPF